MTEPAVHDAARPDPPPAPDQPAAPPPDPEQPGPEQPGPDQPGPKPPGREPAAATASPPPTAQPGPMVVPRTPSAPTATTPSPPAAAPSPTATPGPAAPGGVVLGGVVPGAARSPHEPPTPPSPGPAAPPAAPPARPPSAVRELVRLLDRVDAAALPGAVRVTEIVRVRVAGMADREVGRVRRIGARVRRPRPDPADGEPPALLESVGVPPGGVVERGARVLVLGLVALIVVSAAAAMFQSIDHDSPAGSSPRPGAAPAGGPAAGSGAGEQAGSADQGSADQGSGDQGAETLPSVTIGPGPHDSVADYLGASRQSLATLTAAAPAADLYAVVSLAAGVTPADLSALLRDYRVVSVFFTAGSGGEEEQASVRDPVADVLSAYASAASQADARATAAAGTGDAAARDQASGAAAELRSGCACLFAAVVRAPAGRLAGLATDPRVRVVDPAPPGSGPPAVRFVPLPPDRR